GLLALFIFPVCIALFFLSSPKSGLHFEIVPFADLPGFEAAFSEGASATGGLAAVQTSCKKILSLPQNRRLPGASIGGRYRDWAPACKAVEGIAGLAQLKRMLQRHFLPLEVTLEGNASGIFTGYYEALLKGSYRRTDRFNVPLYSRPPELVMVDLGKFRSDLAGRRIAGSVKNGRLIPYNSRAKIEEGALKGRDLEVLWVDSAVDAYFLHVQGSGRVLMPSGSLLGIGYAAQNGFANQLIGRHLLKIGAIPRKKMSGQAIRAWLGEHPDEVMAVLKTDPSFVFFRELKKGAGPYGSANVVLTPGHSLAVDRKHLPLHAPVWLSASHPDPTAPAERDIAFNRLMVAQDTGGAINGEIRGDVFWGFGDGPEAIAGQMANQGRYWLLLPTNLALKAAGKAPQISLAVGAAQ
ncbi:MAG: MltA domain-containing protein, partial [Kordiimonadaceae bacterium]|nr:MltA domain-containing protein [Kordiimonadaceae bacterium]